MLIKARPTIYGRQENTGIGLSGHANKLVKAAGYLAAPKHCDYPLEIARPRTTNRFKPTNSMAIWADAIRTAKPDRQYRHVDFKASSIHGVIVSTVPKLDRSLL